MLHFFTFLHVSGPVLAFVSTEPRKKRDISRFSHAGADLDPTRVRLLTSFVSADVLGPAAVFPTSG